MFIAGQLFLFNSQIVRIRRSFSFKVLSNDKRKPRDYFSTNCDKSLSLIHLISWRNPLGVSRRSLLSQIIGTH